jgi:hypothetical protein
MTSNAGESTTASLRPTSHSFPFPLLPIAGTSSRLNVPMQNPSFWIHKDGSPEKAVTGADELRCRRMLARQLPLWEYEQLVTARDITIQALIDGKPLPHFTGMPQPA